MPVFRCSAAADGTLTYCVAPSKLNARPILPSMNPAPAWRAPSCAPSASFASFSARHQATSPLGRATQVAAWLAIGWVVACPPGVATGSEVTAAGLAVTGTVGALDPVAPPHAARRHASAPIISSLAIVAGV